MFQYFLTNLTYGKKPFEISAEHLRHRAASLQCVR